MVQNISKYIQVKDLLFSKILKGEFPNQALLPPERELSETYEVSRITLRAALALMEKEGLIQRVQGQGTRVTYKQGATQNPMELIAVVSNSHGPFHSDLMSGVNQMAELNNGLLFIKNEFLRKIFFQKMERFTN